MMHCDFLSNQKYALFTTKGISSVGRSYSDYLPNGDVVFNDVNFTPGSSVKSPLVYTLHFLGERPEAEHLLREGISTVSILACDVRVL